MPAAAAARATRRQCQTKSGRVRHRRTTPPAKSGRHPPTAKSGRHPHTLTGKAAGRATASGTAPALGQTKTATTGRAAAHGQRIGSSHSGRTKRQLTRGGSHSIGSQRGIPVSHPQRRRRISRRRQSHSRRRRFREAVKPCRWWQEFHLVPMDLHLLPMPCQCPNQPPLRDHRHGISRKRL